MSYIVSEGTLHPIETKQPPRAAALEGECAPSRGSKGDHARNQEESDMSAFIVSDAHIDLLVTYATGGGRSRMPDMNPRELGSYS